MIFSSHPSFDKKFKKFILKHNQEDKWLQILKNLLTSHFEKKTVKLNSSVMPPVGTYLDYKIYKIYMAFGLKKKQSPRVFFAIKGDMLIFLCFGTHINNYKTGELIKKSKELLKDFLF